jgi:hypothetical protein
MVRYILVVFYSYGEPSIFLNELLDIRNLINSVKNNHRLMDYSDGMQAFYYLHSFLLKNTLCFLVFVVNSFARCVLI